MSKEEPFEDITQHEYDCASDRQENTFYEFCFRWMLLPIIIGGFVWGVSIADKAEVEYLGILD